MHQCGEVCRKSNYRRPSIPPHCGESPDDLNVFYCRFDTPHPLRHQITTYTPCHPLTPAHLHSGSVRRMCVCSSQTEDLKGTWPRRHVTLLSECLCWPTGPHFHDGSYELLVFYISNLQYINNDSYTDLLPSQNAEFFLLLYQDKVWGLSRVCMGPVMDQPAFLDCCICMQGSCLWTSARHSASSSQTSFTPNTPSSFC